MSDRPDPVTVNGMTVEPDSDTTIDADPPVEDQSPAKKRKMEKAQRPVKEKRTKEKVEKSEKSVAKKPAKVKPEKDPYRPRYAVAPSSVKMAVVTAWVAVVLHVALTALALTISRLQIFGFDVHGLAMVLAVWSAVSVALLLTGAAGLAKGSRTGWKVLLVGSVVAFPLVSWLSLLAATRRDSRDWAI